VTDENKAAESSAAAVAEPEFNPADQHTWSPEQREHWNETGEQPVKPEKQESAPAAPPAKEATSEPEGKTAAESETAPKQGKKERKPGEKLSAEERIAQLTAKVREMEERERSREAAPKPPSTTEPAKQPETPKRPNLATWKGTVEEYEAAMDAWEDFRRKQVLQEFQQAEAAKAQSQKLQKELDDVKAKYPDAQEKINKTFESFAKVQFPGVIVAMLNDSEVLPELMYVLSDETTRSNFIEAAQKTPGKAVRALAQMEADIRAKQSSQRTEEPEKKEPKSSDEPKPRAPKPPSEVGGRGAAGEDELRTAAKANDFRGFEAEMNRRKFAS
jgi:hypothetical protein